jgi:hypothetical protein
MARTSAHLNRTGDNNHRDPTDPSNSSSPVSPLQEPIRLEWNCGFECNLDGSGFTACLSPQTYTHCQTALMPLWSDAIDNAGNHVAYRHHLPGRLTLFCPIQQLRAVQVIQAGQCPFTFSGTDIGTGVAGFECDLDGGGFSACASPQIYYGLTQGSHTFRVRAVDRSGNVDPIHLRLPGMWGCLA